MTTCPQEAERVGAGDGQHPESEAVLVSICIPTFNGERHLEEALSSALDQDYPHIEILLSDDGSVDATREIVRRVSAKHPEKFRILEHERLGMVANWNHLIEKAKGHYIKFLFQDDRLERHCVQEMVRVARRDPKIGLVFSPRNLVVDADFQANAELKQIVKACSDLHKSWTSLAAIQDGTSLLADSGLFKAPINKIGEPTTVMLLRAALLELGGFDSELKHLVDIEMWLRVLCHYKVGFVDQVLSSFRLHGDQQTWKNARAGVEQEDRKRMSEKIRTAVDYAPLRQAQERGRGAGAGTSGRSADAGGGSSLKAQPSARECCFSGMKVSAIVSCYNAEAALRGRLTNLVSQTLFAKGTMEIIVVDSASPQNEGAVAKEFLAQWPERIQYLRTPERETVYVAWNRGINLAKGEYIANANTDDRLKASALERLATYLDDHPACVVVHGDQEATAEVEVPDIEHLSKGKWHWHPYSQLGLLMSTQVGSQPLWRHDLHQRCGLFDTSLRIRGDQDFFIRASELGSVQFIDEVLGSIHQSQNSVSQNVPLSNEELSLLFERYTSPDWLSRLLRVEHAFRDTLDFAQKVKNNFAGLYVIEVLTKRGLQMPLDKIVALLLKASVHPTHRDVLASNCFRLADRFAGMEGIGRLGNRFAAGLAAQFASRARANPQYEFLPY